MAATATGLIRVWPGHVGVPPVGGDTGCLDLATIQRALSDEITVAQAAAAHADALDLQIRTLRLRRAVLRVVAKRDFSTQEMELMHRVVQLSEAERHRLIHDLSTARSATSTPTWSWSSCCAQLCRNYPTSRPPSRSSAGSSSPSWCRTPTSEPVLAAHLHHQRLADHAPARSIYEWLIKALRHHPKP